MTRSSSTIRELALHDEFLFFTHDPRLAAARVRETAGRFQPSQSSARSAPGLSINCLYRRR